MKNREQDILNDFSLEIFNLNYLLEKTKGTLNGTRYPTTNPRRVKKDRNSNKNK